MSFCSSRLLVQNSVGPLRSVKRVRLSILSLLPKSTPFLSPTPIVFFLSWLPTEAVWPTRLSVCRADSRRPLLLPCAHPAQRECSARWKACPRWPSEPRSGPKSWPPPQEAIRFLREGFLQKDPSPATSKSTENAFQCRGGTWGVLQRHTRAP